MIERLGVCTALGVRPGVSDPAVCTGKVSGRRVRHRPRRVVYKAAMNHKKLEDLRAKYPADAPSASHHPEFKKAIETIFAGTNRRPKPYEGVAIFLGAPLRLDAPEQADFGGLDVALVGVPLDLGVTNRAGARF